MNKNLSLLRRSVAPTIASVVVIAALSVFARGQSSTVEGHWEGTVQTPGTALVFSVDFSAKTGGGISGAISIPAQNAAGLPLEKLAVKDADISFVIAGVPGEPTFSGKLDPGGAMISGQLNQGGQSFPFTLERKQDPVAQSKEALAGFDQVATDAMKKFDVPGMAIAIVKGKQIVYSRGFGYRDVEKQLPATPDTLFAIGSSTKAFTTFVLGTLVDEGKIEWEKPVRNYIPWFKLYDASASEHITPRDLVTHRSGLPRHDLVWYNNYDATRKWLVERLAYLEPTADLRTQFQYNNLMFLTAGYLSEVVTGKTWEQNVRDRILDPLGMQRTTFSVLEMQKDSDFSQPYQKKDDRVVKMPFRQITNIGPAGAINSSVNEMSRWVVVHLNGGKYEGKELAKASTVDDMHTSHMTTGETNEHSEISPADYGMGWFVQAYRGHQWVQHGGNIDGFSAMVALFPQDGVGIVVLTNLNATPLGSLLVQTAMDRLLGLKPIDWIGVAAAKRAKGEEATKEGAKKKEVTRMQGTHPAHNLEDYAGDYENLGYGVLKVSAHEGHLEAVFNGINTPLEHWHYETFSGLKTDDASFEDMKYTFQTDSRGYVSALSAPFEPAVKDIVFVKKPDARLFDAEYLKRFAGSYELPGQAIAIGLKGNALTAIVAGSPALDLVPVLGGDFAIKQAQIVTIHFVTDSAGNVTAFELRQPGVVLTAKRKQ
jgi:CubicO group peptidase (beta-lactamase class C family)